MKTKPFYLTMFRQNIDTFINYLLQATDFLSHNVQTKQICCYLIHLWIYPFYLTMFRQNTSKALQSSISKEVILSYAKSHPFVAKLKQKGAISIFLSHNVQTKPSKIRKCNPRKWPLSISQCSDKTLTIFSYVQCY